MIYRFADFELDKAKAELRSAGQAVALEPQVFALILLLVEARDRLVSKEELIEQIWNGRFISDAAIASRIKSARQALGDDGTAQAFIRTVHGRGFRFVAEVKTADAPRLEIVRETLDPSAVEQKPLARPSIAVLPFRLIGAAGPHAAIADALPHDLITELARLRWLFMIARASSFRFRGADAELDNVRVKLKVRYCLTGDLEVRGDALTISVELGDTETKGVVWSDRFSGKAGAVHEFREQITRDVINALELQIPLNEARRARLRGSNNLDAWAAYHLGLQHMYRFTKADNAQATGYFQRAAELDPEFARAYAGLSFTHFQDAFLAYDDHDRAAKLAQHYAQQCLERDPADPFGNFTMGRSYWLIGDHEASLPWLDRANTLNPNYAHARYARSFTHGLLGAAQESRVNADEAMALSPLDPFLYAMYGARAFSHIVLGDAAGAASYADRSASAPAAHALVQLLAVACHSMNGEDVRARHWAELVRQRMPDVCKEDLLRAFPFRNAETNLRLMDALARYGF